MISLKPSSPTFAIAPCFLKFGNAPTKNRCGKLYDNTYHHSLLPLD